MNNYYIVFNSITFATRVKRFFLGDGSDIGLLHTPKSIPVNGCSYSLRTRKEKTGEILAAAEELGIKTKGVFIENNGEFEGVADDLFR